MKFMIPNDLDEQDKSFTADEAALNKAIRIGLTLAFAGFVLGMVGLTLMH